MELPVDDASFFGARRAPRLTQRKAGGGPLGMLGAMPSPPALPPGPHQAPLVRAALPGKLSASAADLLAQAATERRFTKGQAVLVSGTPATSAWLVVEGRVAQGPRAPSSPAPRRVAVAGQWLDLPNALLGMVHAEDACAESNCRLLELHLDRLLRRDAQQAGRLSALAILLAAEALRLGDSVRNLATKDATARIATWLIAQAQVAGPDAAFRLPQRKRDVAVQLGTTAETLSRTLARLSTGGAIGMDGRSITLLDLPALERLAEPPDPG
jgi:CRP-like cAMP-binding protein